MLLALNILKDSTRELLMAKKDLRWRRPNESAFGFDWFYEQRPLILFGIGILGIVNIHAELTSVTRTSQLCGLLLIGISTYLYSKRRDYRIRMARFRK